MVLICVCCQKLQYVLSWVVFSKVTFYFNALHLYLEGINRMPLGYEVNEFSQFSELHRQVSHKFYKQCRDNEKVNSINKIVQSRMQR